MRRAWLFRRLTPAVSGAAAFAVALFLAPVDTERTNGHGILSGSAAVAQSTGIRRRVIIRRQPTRVPQNRLRKTTKPPPKPPSRKTAKPRAVPPPPPRTPPSSVPQPPGTVAPPRIAVGNSDLLPPDVRRRLLIAPAVSFPADESIAGERRPQQVIVTFAQAPSPADLAGIAQQYGLSYVDGLTVAMLSADVHRFTFAAQRSFDEVANTLVADARIAAAQPSFVFRVQGKSDPGSRIKKQAAMQYALTKLKVPQAHQRATGKAVRIAVIDTLVDTAHPEFKGAALEVFDAVPGSKAGPDDHGTAISGIIAAQQTLGGVAPGVHLLAVRSFVPVKGSPLDAGDTMSLLRGLDWAERNGAQVFNMSFAGPEDPLLSRVLDAAYERNIILVAAGGNAGPGSPPLYPAAHARVIAVTATDWSDANYDQANRGAHIAIAAPGVEVLAVSPGGSYAMTSGTSFATAHVSALVALLLEAHPGLKPDAVLELVRSSATDLGVKGPDAVFGAGLADALRALEAGDRIGRMAQ